MAARCTAEFIGTFFLMYSLGTCVTTEGIGCAMSVGATLAVMVYALGSVSGAHFNPAVSLAIFLSGRQKISGLDAFCYVLAQLAGAISAVNLSWFMMPLDATGAAAFHVPAPNQGYTHDHATGVEVIYSMALCYVVLNSATVDYKQEAENAHYGLSIGMTVTSSVIAIGPISGCSLNPALSLGSTLAASWAQGYLPIRIWGLYVCAPLIGAFLAACGFWLVRGGLFQRHEYGDKEPVLPQTMPTYVPTPREASKPTLLNKNQPVLIPSEVVEGDLHCLLQWGLQTRGKTIPTCDLDLTCVKFGRKVDCLGAVYFAKKVDQGIRHCGDDVYDNKDPGQHEEKIYLRLSEIKANVTALVFVVMIYSGESFDDVTRYSFKLKDGKPGQQKDICRYDRKSVGDGANAQIAGMVYRQNADWYFKAIDECHSAPPNSSYRKLLGPLQAQVAETLGVAVPPPPEEIQGAV